MRDYINRHFMTDRNREQHLVQRTTAMLRNLCLADVRHGVIDIVSHVGEGSAHLQILLRGYVNRVFFRGAARRLVKILRHSSATVTLHIEALRTDHQRQLRRLLKRLSPYGDRVSIWIDERIQPLVSIDSSVFHLLLTRDTNTGVPST